MGSATEELRRMLDDLGVEHRDADETIGDGDGSDPYGQRHFTRWFHHGMECTFAHSTHDDGWKETVFDGGLATDFTPAQAIAATVGKETEFHICKRCGVAYELDILDKGFGKARFCPNCGYKEMYQ